MSRALGRYELLRPLARGGMAEVFLARRRAAGVEKWLVVKRIRAERATDVQFLDLFVREARLSMSLAHQNIVPVFDFGRIDDQVFLAMERVEGRDLGSCLTRSQSLSAPLSPLLAAFIAAECCQALDYAHRRKSPEGQALGIVHRDVTPRNVLLSWSGEVKLTDFGIAALAGDATTTLLGTPAYMAPEQARRETLDARTDVYAVGLVLREMLTGTRARGGADRDSLLGAARTGNLLPWPEHSLPPALVAIVDRATSTSPSDRHTDARALLAELDEFLVGERAAKRADSPTRQLAAWLDRVWGAERDDDAGTSGEIVADHMVSFLDDGQLDVLGTGTQRSMLATAGEDVVASISPFDDTLTAAAKRESKPIVPATDESAAGAKRSESGSAKATSEPEASVSVAGEARSVTAAGAVARTNVDAIPIVRPTSSDVAGGWRWLALGLVALITIGALVFVMTRGENNASTANDASFASADPVVLPDALTAISIDAAPIAPDSDVAISNDAVLMTPDVALITPDAALTASDDAGVAMTRDAVPPARDAGLAMTRDAAPLARDASIPAARDATIATTRDASIATRDAAIAGLQRVTINSRPWSNFRVDDDPTDHETPSTVMLSPGPHRIRFHNPELKLSKDVTIEVPSDRDMKHVENLP